jgi:hypothetical protein
MPRTKDTACYLAGNIGYAIGPMIGASFGIAGNVWAFLFAALVYLVYFVFMSLMIRLVLINTQPEDRSERVRASVDCLSA